MKNDSWNEHSECNATVHVREIGIEKKIIEDGVMLIEER